MATEKVTISLRNILSDAVALLFILFVPALSHLTSLPFYLLDPMRLAALGVLLATRDWKNSLALAVLLPLFSMAVSGHPVFPKCLLISVELATNVLLFEGILRLLGRRLSQARLVAGVSAFLSILLSKGVYYLLKWMVISLGWMQMELVSTGLWIQLIVAVAISLVFALAYPRSATPRREP